MIQTLTKVKITDNSGAKIGKVIKILGGSKAKIGKIGKVIVVAVQKIKYKPKGKFKKGDVSRALVVRTAKEHTKGDSAYIKFANNAVILLDKDGKPAGTRVSGTVVEELRRRKLMKVLTLSSKLF